MTGPARLVAAAVALALTASAGCASGDDELTSAEGAGTTKPAGPGAQVGDRFDEDEPELDEALRSFYQEFLHTADLHRIPNDLVRQYGSGLPDLAEPPVVAFYERWRAANEAHGDGFQRVTEFTSIANVLAVDVDGPRVTIRDCTKEQEVTIGGHDVAAYVTRVVTVANHGGLYRVAAIDVSHEGRIDSPGYSCIPRPMAEDAAETVTTTVDQFSAAQADPGQGLPAALDAVVAGDLQRRLTSSLAEQAGRNLAITSPSDVAVEVAGLDPRGVGVIAVVSACITYPEGLAMRELASKKVVREVFPAGTRNTITYAVRLNESGGPAAIGIMDEKRSTAC